MPTPPRPSAVLPAAHTRLRSSRFGGACDPGGRTWPHRLFGMMASWVTLSLFLGACLDSPTQPSPGADAAGPVTSFVGDPPRAAAGTGRPVPRPPSGSSKRLVTGDQIVTLFDNGSSSHGAMRNQAGIFEQYEDFQLSQPSVITSIHWRVSFAVIDGKDGSMLYRNTELRIFDGLPYEGSEVFSGPFVADGPPSGSFSITGLSIALDAGTYWLGLNDNSTTDDFLSGWATTPGGPNTIPGSREVALDIDCGGGVDIAGCGPGNARPTNFLFSLRGRWVS